MCRMEVGDLKRKSRRLFWGRVEAINRDECDETWKTSADICVYIRTRIFGDEIKKKKKLKIH